MTHPHRRSVGLAGLLLAVLAADAYAQIGAPLPLKVEDEIIVTDSAGTRTAGRISAITGESLTIQSPDGLWNGTLIGIGAGVAAEVAGIATSHGGVSGPEVIGRLVVGSAFGAAAGSLVDRAITIIELGRIVDLVRVRYIHKAFVITYLHKVRLVVIDPVGNVLTPFFGEDVERVPGFSKPSAKPADRPLACHLM